MGINLYNFAVNHNEAAILIANAGQDVTFILKGEPGSGKSSVLDTMRTHLGDGYDYIYVDVPLKDIPQIALSMPNHEKKVVDDYIHSLWLGTDPSKPKVVMLDEIGKGNEYVKLMMNRVILEHMIGDHKLPDGSIVFGTTNFETDGLNDRTNGHTNNRLTELIFRKPAQDEWMHWANNHDIHPIVRTWAEQNPAIFGSYKDTEFDARLHKDGEGIFHYIYHPQHNNKAYVSPRSLHKASHLLHRMDAVGEALVTKALIGTIGSKAALDISALIALGSDLPHPKDIEANPTAARVPKSGPAQLMMAFKSTQYLKAENMDAYATYFSRLPVEIMSTWVKTLIGIEHIKQFAIKNQKVREFSIKNAWVL